MELVKVILVLELEWLSTLQVYFRDWGPEVLHCSRNEVFSAPMFSNTGF